MKKIKNLIKKIPFLGDFLLRQKIKYRFRKERQLLKGKCISKSDYPSIIHFSFNKSATQHIKTILKRCAIENNLLHIRLNEFAFASELPFLNHLSTDQMKEYKHAFKPKGYLYSAFGGMVKGIPDLDMYKVVLVVRDPRDILVSEYYSMKFSHSVPPRKSDKRKNFLLKRKKAQGSSIDEYVISYCGQKIKLFNEYKKHLLEEHSDIYITKFEEMIEDYEQWLKNLLSYCDLKISSDLFEVLIRENERITSKKENVHKHVRKGEAGDFKEKLSPKTISLLNNRLEPMLKTFGYK